MQFNALASAFDVFYTQKDGRDGRTRKGLDVRRVNEFGQQLTDEEVETAKLEKKAEAVKKWNELDKSERKRLVVDPMDLCISPSQECSGGSCTVSETDSYTSL